MKFTASKKTDVRVAFIIIVLFSAIFNDIIRIPGTKLSLYRLLLPFVITIALLNLKHTYHYFALSLALLGLSVIQNFVFIYMFEYENRVDVKWQIRYIIHYGSIIAIFLCVHLLRVWNNDVFKSLMQNGSVFIGLLIMIGYAVRCMNIGVSENLANVNNYGAELAVLFPWYMIKGVNGRTNYFLLCLIILLELVWGDSKSALMGVLIEAAIVVIMYLSKKIREGNKVVLPFIIISATIFLMFILSPIKINGYSIKGMFLGLMKHVASGDPYDVVVDSLTYRTNSIIYMLKGIIRSCFIGIGPGNCDKLLGYCMPDEIEDGGTHAISPHNALLSTICEAGIWIIVICIIVLYYAIKKMLNPKRSSELDMYFVAFVISFPIWVMSASGIYTTYLIFIAIAWIYGRYKGDRKLEKEEKQC